MRHAPEYEFGQPFTWTYSRRSVLVTGTSKTMSWALYVKLRWCRPHASQSPGTPSLVI